MTKKFLALFSLILITACGNDKSKSEVSDLAADEARVVGHILNYSASDSIKEIPFYLTEIMEGNIDYKTPIDSLGNFTITIKTEEAKEIKLYYKTWLNLIVKNGESLDVCFDGRDSTSTMRYKSASVKGSLAQLNQHFFEYLAGDPMDENAYYEAIQTLEPVAFKKFHDSIFAIKDAYIASFLSEHDLSQVLKNWLQVEKDFVPTVKLFQYYYFPESKYGVSQNQNMIRDSININLEKLPVLTKEHMVNSEVLSSFARNYFFYIENKVRKTYKGVSTAEMDSLILSVIVNKNRDNPLLAQLAINERLVDLFNSYELTYYDENKAILEPLYNGSFFVPLHAKKLQEIKALLANPVLPDKTEILTFETEDSSKYLEEIIRNADGKVIYIDNWATWCAPCKSEFKYSTPAFKAKFDENVEFIYLCYQSKRELWKPTISEYKIEGKHYFIEKEKEGSLIEQTDLGGFPWYTIINKRGEIIQNGFEYRPSLPSTSDILTKLIAEE